VVSTVFVNVTATTPFVIWNVPAPIIYGTALSVGQLNASAGVPGTFVLYAGSRNCPCGRVADPVGHFHADRHGVRAVDEDRPADVSEGDADHRMGDAANIVAGTPLSATQLNATVATPAGTLVYSPAAGPCWRPGPAQRLGGHVHADRHRELQRRLGARCRSRS
jgi:hypothetical protein